MSKNKINGKRRIMKNEILLIGILVLFALTGTAFAEIGDSEANILIHSGTGSWVMCSEPESVEEPVNIDNANMTKGGNDSINNTFSYASGKTWYVDDDGGPGIDFTKIQDAVNAATAGDTIIVKDGTYYEQVKLNKQLTIEGENRPVINAAGKPQNYGIFIDHTSGCVIRGLEIKPSTEVEVGIYLYYSHSNQIIDNIASNHRYGIAVVYSNDNVVNANVVYDNLGGIGVWYSTGNNISDNIAYDNYDRSGGDSGNIGINDADNNDVMNNTVSTAQNAVGIGLWDSDNCILSDNTARNNRNGIYISGSSNTSLNTNIMEKNKYNFGVLGAALSDFIHTIDTANTIDGKPIIYLVNEADQTVDATSNAGYVGVVNSSNIVVENLNLSNNIDGVLFAFTNNSEIKNLYITHNLMGICLNSSSNNQIRHNTLINNTVSAYDDIGNNNWNTSYPLGGNYWSDYSGTDKKSGVNQDQPNCDSIGDIPYDIKGDAGAKDYYPLMVPLIGQCLLPWGSEKLGLSPCIESVCGKGCALTSTAMVFRYYGVDTNPDKLNKCLKANKGFSGCLIKWDVAANNCSEEKVKYTYESSSLLDQELDAGHPVILHVPRTNPYHFVVATSRMDDTYYINDPLDYGDRTTLKKYGNTFDSIRMFKPRKVDMNLALGKPVTVITNGADEPHEHVGEWPSDITDGSLDYQPSGIEDGCVAWVNDDYNELMVVTVSIDLQGIYNINKIRYNMGDCQRAETWNADIMESPFGRAPTNPGTPHLGAWTEQTGDITASSVTIKFEKTRTAWERDWLFIGEIEVWGAPVENPPIANAGGPYYGYVNESIQFYGTGTDLDGHIDAHEWDFDGDNITDSTLPNPNHSWSVAGTYYPTLKVQDNDGAWSEPDVCEVHVYERGELTVLIVTNFQRMRDIGYGDASVDALQNKVIVDLKRNNPQGKCALVDLDLIPAIKSDYDIWAGHEGDITRTNYLVQRIDDYIEEQKRIRFPMLKYVIIVGSHEVIPMKARPDDFFDEKVSEKQWAEEILPQNSGYLYEIYKNGFYLTDTIYADLSYMDSTKDHELTPELAVGRLVETPEQIIKVIDAYMNNKGEIPKKQFLSIAAYDYKDSASKADEEMRKSGVPTHYVSDCRYSSSLVPFAFNTKKPDVTYLSGHGDYNEIWTNDSNNDCFMAGEHSTRGDTSEISNLDGAVIINAGCHNGINLGNKLYHEPDAGTEYSDFPEEFAKKGVVAYIGATGYTRITDTDCSNDTNEIGGNEEVAMNTIHRLLCGTDIGTAHRDGLMLYYIKASTTSPISHEDRRVLAIPTLYGISTYKDPISGNGAISSGTGYSIKIVWGTQQSNPEELSITISNYSIDYNSGIVTIPGTSQIVSSNEPIIPILFVEKTLPRGSNITNVVWNETASDNVTVINDIPIPTIGFGEEQIKGNFSYDGFYPPIPFANYSVLTLGGGGSEVGISVTPVQYNSKTNQTKIWTRMLFDIYYDVPDTGISVVNLSTDKSKYTPKDYVELKTSLLNEGSNTSVNLSVLLRNLNTSEVITEIYAGTADLGSGTTSVTSSICLQSIPLNQIVGKDVQCELLVSNPYNLEILASESVAFSVTSRGLCGDVAPCPDCDGTVDMGDVILLLNNVSYPENPRYVLCNDWSGDCRCTGVRDMGDVILLLNNVSYPENPIYALDCC